MLLEENGPGLLSWVGPRVRSLAHGGLGWPGSGALAPPARPRQLEVRLAAGAGDVRRAQRLRYKVFFEEGDAQPSPAARIVRRDADAFDPICDHLVVLDHAARAKPFRAARPRVVGTCRLLRRSVAEARSGFYAASEFDVAPLLAAHPGTRILELGRSCVLEAYRGRRTVELLWQGIWDYCGRHGIEAMIGCASFRGTDPDRLAGELSYLHHRAPAPEGWRVRARPERRVEMNRLPGEAVSGPAALRAMPPLIKGYLRVGAGFGDGAVIDHAFGTTDVFVVLPVAAIAGRYRDHFGPARRMLD